MALTLWYHPFSSFCMKALIALYECGAAFDPVIVDLGDESARAAFYALWPIGKFPVLRDEASGELVPESTIIIEYLAHRHPAAGMIPAEPAAAREVRLWDRLFDDHLHHHMQKVVADRLRPVDSRDPYGVAEARARIRQSYDLIERRMEEREWAAGDFSMADCAAAPALHYAWKVEPWGDRPALSGYFSRLASRPSFARVLAEAQPYAHFFPQE
ncbi:glutathione S-transferase family protein [Rhizorhabdus argentea]|uniref:glutathione S-transferase family protein n=1 Tax=Rhizorhabdus argentea TaxID=1387174 RepID=UPI003BF55103